ncbi:MAG TPA: DCC1-like thiol-disulfide oxidoreductase family protein [Gemmatimonadaceae bacterium]|nr:DCC1-like thiol-disulfide oxidoreductase family protein [Gemmatimonadaceae bacterium]
MIDRPVLLYDGLCGFCDGTVQFILRHDRRGTLRFATLQGDFARAVIARHPEVAGVDSLVLVEPDGVSGEKVYVRSEGALRVARYLGGAWHVTRIVAIVPRVLRDWAYDAFARVRYRVFGRYDSCPIPTPEQRGRFID